MAHRRLLEYPVIVVLGDCCIREFKVTALLGYMGILFSLTGSH